MLAAATDLRNAGAAGMDRVIDNLAAQRAAVAAQAYARALDDPTMSQALAALQGATAQMNTVAASMVSATTFIRNLASVATVTNNLISSLGGDPPDRKV
jgi:hypothetical protein